MLTKSIKTKLILFLIIGVLAVGYGSWRYAGGDKLIGNRTYAVKMNLGDTTGIFTNAEVTYRGVAVGRVGNINLTQSGLQVELDVERSAPDIPRDVAAVVANRSAVGEQYVDLQPKDSHGPYLKDLADNERVIAAKDTTTPLPPQTLLNNLNGLSTSLPLDSLRTVVNELDTGFSGTGPDLQRILDAGQNFTKGAQANFPATKQLLSSSRTVLDTQNEEASNLKSFSKNLRDVSQTLKSSDGDIRKVIKQAPPALNELNGVVNDNGKNLSSLLANGLTVSELLRTRNAGLEQALVTYPELVGGADTALGPDGRAHLGLVTNLFDPPECTKGYEGTKRRGGADTKPLPMNRNAYCAEPAGSPIDVRGSQNAPYAGVPVSVPPGSAQSGQSQSAPAPAPAGSVGGVLGIAPLGPGASGLAKFLKLG
jgi:phospholipid/cholesterol/gamma-HCH transport system substrate-binding protein